LHSLTVDLGSHDAQDPRLGTRIGLTTSTHAPAVTASLIPSGHSGASPYQIIGYRLLAIGYSRSDSCPEARSSFVVSLNMNTDYGFFQLFRALKSLRDNKTGPALGEEGSAIEQKLPHIDYSLLRSLTVRQYRYQQPPFRSERFHLGLRPLPMP
jgi:hypothetical protein